MASEQVKFAKYLNALSKGATKEQAWRISSPGEPMPTKDGFKRMRKKRSIREVKGARATGEQKVRAKNNARERIEGISGRRRASRLRTRGNHLMSPKARVIARAKARGAKGATMKTPKSMAMANKTITIKMPKTVSSPTSGKANKIAGAGAVGQKASKG